MDLSFQRSRASGTYIGGPSGIAVCQGWEAAGSCLLMAKRRKGTCMVVQGDRTVGGCMVPSAKSDCIAPAV